MAKPTTLSFGNFKIWIEDANSPNSFLAPCGFNQKSMTLTAATSEALLPDCDDPEAPAWIDRAVTSLSAAVNGQGILAMDSLSLWRTWMLSGESRQVRVEFDDTGTNGGGFYQGYAILTSLGQEVQLGSEGNKAQLPVEMQSTGEWTWTSAAG